MSSDIYKKMGKRAFGGATTKRPATQSTEAGPASKKPAEPTNGLCQGQPAPGTPPASLAENLAAPPATDPPGSPAESQATPPATPDVKPPPFFIPASTEWPALAAKLKELVGGDFCAIARGKFLRVRTSTIDGFRKIQRHLLIAKVAFHTFSVGNGRSLKVVISGLPAYVGEEELLTALGDEGYDVQSANRLRTRSGASGRWLVTFAPDCERDEGQRKAAEIWKLDCFMHVRPTISGYRKPAGPPQCYHCQRFGHGSGYCGYPARCVRCAGAHTTARCQQPKGSRKCCNCEGDHQANWRGCPAYHSARTAARPYPPRPRAKRPAPRTRRQPPETPKDQPSERAPAAADSEKSTAEEDEGFATVTRKRRKRPPRNQANRRKRAATDQAATTEETPAPHAPTPAPAPAPAKATTPVAAPRPAPEKPARPSDAAPTTPHQTAAPAVTPETAQIFKALTEMVGEIRLLTQLISQLVQQLR